jgi:hypothetical protein
MPAPFVLLFGFLDYNQSIYLFVPNCLHTHNSSGQSKFNQQNVMNLQIQAMLGGQLTKTTSNTYGKVGGADARLHGGSHDGER